MCGDPCCWSCGPAQGNYKCEICGKWSMDGGCDDPDACAEKAKEGEQTKLVPCHGNEDDDESPE